MLLPVFTHLRVQNYGLFPGKPAGTGIDWSLDKGIWLIAGVNGLGKTTLLAMILRCLTGPYDLTGEGVSDTLKSVLPESPVSLSTQAVRYFLQRVDDQAKDATV